MLPIKKEIRIALRMGIKTLILQEVQLLRLERTLLPPYLVIESQSYSIQETKKTIVRLIQEMEKRKRMFLLRRMINKVVDDEIDRTVQLRQKKCFRCLHMRYYNQKGVSYESLPLEGQEAHMVGCDKIKSGFQKECKRFAETTMAESLEDYLNEITLLYEVKDVFNRIQGLWEDYLLT